MRWLVVLLLLLFRPSSLIVEEEGVTQVEYAPDIETVLVVIMNLVLFQ